MVARNRSRDFLRHKLVHTQRLFFFCEVEARSEEDEVTFLEVIPDMGPVPEERAELHDLQREIRHAIRSLPHARRQVVWHFYTSDFTYAEIGRILDRPGSTVKIQFNRAKPQLRDALKIACT